MQATENNSVTVRFTTDEISRFAEEYDCAENLSVINAALYAQKKRSSNTGKLAFPAGRQVLLDLARTLLQPQELTILQHWSDDYWANALKTFAIAIAEFGFDTYNGFRGTRKLSEFNRKLAIAGMFVRGFPEDTRSQVIQFKIQFRIWIFIQNLRRIEKYGHVLDSNILNIAHFFNHHDNSEIIKTIVTHIPVRDSSESLEHFTLSLRLASYRCPKQKAGTRAYKFLTSLQAVCKGEFNQEQLYEPHNVWLIPFSNPEEKPNPIFVFEDIKYQVAYDESGDITADLISIPDENETYEEQHRSANSVMRSTAEKLSFLQYSRFKPTPGEIAILNEWIQTGLVSDCQIHALGVALTAIAICTSESLLTVQFLPIGNSPNPDWCINDSFTVLYQASPRHRGAWKPRSDNETQWVESSSESFNLNVNSSISQILTSVYLNAPLATQLGALWHSVSTQTLESWFRKEMQSAGQRLLSGMLPEILPQEIYNSTGQGVLSTLLCAHSQTALTGASAYVSNTESDIRDIFNNTSVSKIANFSSENPTHYAVGSRLVLAESLIRSEITKAKQSLEKLRCGNPIEFHNAYVAYCVMTLLAATGSRPVNDPFENLNDFNFDKSLVVVEDKADNNIHGPRVIPLTRTTIELVGNHYLKHLQALANALDGHELSLQIRQLLNGSDQPGLPLFFFIENTGRTTSVSLSSPEIKKLFDWPLNSNLFRHYFIQKLLSFGVDSEVVEAWAGHIELNLQTYGIHSERCWVNDSDTYRSHIQNLLYYLGFEPIQGFTVTPRITFDIHSYPKNEVFGRKAREVRRNRKIELAIKEVDLQFEVFTFSLVDNEPTQEQLDQLIDEVIYTGKKNHTYRNHLSIRFERIIFHLHNLVESRNLTPYRYKKIARHFSCPPNIFSVTTPTALTLNRKVNELFDEMVKNTKYAPSQISSHKAAQIAAVAVCIKQRITYPELVKDIASQQHYRLIKFKKRYYLEYSEQLKLDDFQAPVQRHELHPVVTRYLNKSLKSKSNTTEPIYEPLMPLVRLLCCSTEATLVHFLECLCKIVDLHNSIFLPGIVSGALCGKIPPTSLNIPDWVRTLTRQIILLPQTQENISDNTATDESDYSPLDPTLLMDSTEDNVSELNINQKRLGQASAQTYIQALRNILHEYKPSNPQATVSSIKRHNQSYSSQTSSMMLALGEWISDRISKGHRNRKQPLAKKTVTDYFSTLSSRFGGLVYEIDLHELYSEDLTEIYASMLEQRSLSSTTLNDARDRLIDFHSFIEKAYHVPKPNWAELGVPELGRNVNPGWLGEEDYLLSLKLLGKSSLFDCPKTLDFSAFVMILCKRYGLRRLEALYLRRTDIFKENGQYTVRIEAYNGRGLKSPSSRRIIPPIDVLTDDELQIVNNVIAHYEILIPKRRNLPLVYIVPGRLQREAIRNIPRLIISTIREVTGTTHLVLHHLRHSFLTKAACSVLPVNTALSKRIEGDRKCDVRNSLLGNNNAITRRSSMGLARIMGHATPNTGLRSYNHIVTEWIDQCVGPFQITKRPFEHAIDLDEMPTRPANISLKRQIKLPDFKPVSINRILEMMRYVGAGYSPHKACQVLKLSSNIADMFVPFYLKATKMLWFRISGGGSISGRDNPQLIFSRLTGDAWSRLMSVDATTTMTDTADFPAIDELQFLIGQSRQILLKKSSHFALMRYVLDRYEICSEDYHLLCRDEPVNYIPLAEKHQFDSALLKQVERLKIDNLRKPNDQYERRYAALQLKPSAQCKIQKKSELAVAFLACGFALAIQQM